MTVFPKYKVAAVQAAPVYLDRDATVAKGIKLIEEAAAQGAKLIAFPECWIPGYPWWVWLDAPAWGMQFVRRYFENALEVGDAACKALCSAARKNKIFVVMGFVERAGGSLFISQLTIDDQGELLHARRKLRATHVERTVFGEGDGSDLAVHATAIGNLGALNCWEHTNPLTKYAMFAQNEQIHVASWPSFTLYVGQAYALGCDLNAAFSQVYAAEGQCFVVVSSNLVSQDMQDILCDTPAKRQMLGVGGGIAQVYGPNGQPLCTPLAPDAEGVLYCDIDLGDIALAKAAADPIGHYSRPDVYRLLLNTEKQSRVERFVRAAPSVKTVALDDEKAAMAQTSEEALS
jgi:nitrilase